MKCDEFTCTTLVDYNYRYAQVKWCLSYGLQNRKQINTIIFPQLLCNLYNWFRFAFVAVVACSYHQLLSHFCLHVLEPSILAWVLTDWIWYLTCQMLSLVLPNILNRTKARLHYASFPFQNQTFKKQCNKSPNCSNSVQQITETYSQITELFSNKSPNCSQITENCSQITDCSQTNHRIVSQTFSNECGLECGVKNSATNHRIVPISWLALHIIGVLKCTLKCLLFWKKIS